MERVRTFLEDRFGNLKAPSQSLKGAWGEVSDPADAPLPGLCSSVRPKNRSAFREFSG